MTKAVNARGGFTLIEVLVASLLLGMLVSILTMVFNQSAIAWRTGKAGVSQLGKLRRQLSFAQYTADNILPRVDANSKGVNGLVLSAWNEKGEVRRRAVTSLQSAVTPNFQLPNFNSYESSGTKMVTPWAQISTLHAIRSGKESTFVVGVLSYGPDGVKDTDDDITSWPEDVQ